MSAEFETVLDECLERVGGGESLDACLRDYPALAGDLQPLLAMAVGLRAAPAPRAREAAVTAGKQRVLAAFSAQLPAAGTAPAGGPRLVARLAAIFHIWPTTNARYALRLALGILIVLALGTTSAVAASSRSLPGDALYPVKQSVESVRLALTLDNQSRQILEEQFEGQRLLEIQSLMQLRRQQTVEFEDVLQAMGENGWWAVGPFAVQVNDSTEVAGRPAPGGRVRVQARIQGDGTLVALRITEEAEQGHEPEHGSGADGIEFGAPLPTAPTMHEPEHQALPEPTGTHRAEPTHGSEHAAAPTTAAHEESLPAPETDHHTQPAVQPTAVPTHRPEPTGAPHKVEPTAAHIQHLEPTAEPLHQPAPTAQPAPQVMPTPEPPDHDTAPAEEPPHDDPAPNGEGEAPHDNAAPGEGGREPRGGH